MGFDDRGHVRVRRRPGRRGRASAPTVPDGARRRTPARYALLLCGLVVAGPFVTARAEPVPEPAQRVTLDARYTPSRRRIEATVTIELRNTARAPLRELVFHRYLEAFRDERSVFARESRGAMRGVRLGAAGATELRSLEIDGVDALARVDRELVDGDFTQFSVPLETPLEPGDGLRIRIAYAAHLPELAARAGTSGRFHVLGQWFPKLAKLEPDGTFASFPYHGNGEFYADFARYEVTLTVPSEYAVEGTGRRVDLRTEAGWTRHRFVASPVHDAAYVVAHAMQVSTSRCDGVDVRVGYLPGYAGAADEHADATCFGLRSLGRTLFPYPYDTLTVVVPPRGAAGGAGMEYPTFFLTDGPWFAHRHLPIPGAIDTTFHELAHQWFQGMVATNEVAHPVLDEGLASYFGYDLVRAYAGATTIRELDWLRPHGAAADVVPASKPAHAYTSFDYARTIYVRSALVIESLCRTYGRAKVHAALGRYARTNRFGHPAPADLSAAFDEEFGGGFSSNVLEPLFFRSEPLTFRIVQDAEGARAARTGPFAVPVELALDADSPRRTRVTTATRALPTSGCARLDPDSRLLLDPARRDDERCADRTASAAHQLLGLVRMLLRGLGP